MTQAFLHHLGSFVARASQTHADDQQMQARLQQLADDLSPKQNLGCGSLYVLGLSRWPCSASQSAPGSRMRSERWGRRRLKRVLLQRPSHGQAALIAEFMNRICKPWPKASLAHQPTPSIR